jgi:hypothetical protein
VGTNEGGWPTPALKDAWENALRPILNAPANVVATEDPLLAPPLYGAAQAKVAQVEVGSPNPWLEQLNLAPWHRAVARLGTRVVQEQQDALMASAWDQAAQLARVNQLLRQAQLGCRVAWSLHARHSPRWMHKSGSRVLAPRRMPCAAARGNALVDTGLQFGLLHRAASVASPRRIEPAIGARRRHTPSAHDRGVQMLQPLQLLRRHSPATGHSLERVATGLISNVFWNEGTARRRHRAQTTVLRVRPAGCSVRSRRRRKIASRWPLPAARQPFVVRSTDPSNRRNRRTTDPIHIPGL